MKEYFKNEQLEISCLNDAPDFDVEELEERLELALGTVVNSLCTGNVCGGNACAGNINGLAW